MTDSDLKRIEKELNIVLPRSYREFMQSGELGARDKGFQDFTGVADEVIEMTEDLRKNGFYGAKWPANYLVIGDDGAGDYYFTDVNCDNPAVRFADHELTTNRGELVLGQRQQHQTFSQFWNFLEEINRRRVQAQANRCKKQWWQFWKENDRA